MSLALDLRQGAVFDGQFRVLGPLARGGMGAVYAVEQLATARPRALKLMHPGLVHDDRSRERFEREAQLAGRIESDHVVEVIAAGVEASTGTPWLCMELLEGEDLAARMARGRPPPGEVVEIVAQLGHALTAAHRAGIVHRDLKPENLFLAAPRRAGVPFTVKVLDFGIAALVQDATGASKSTQGVGSPLWMAPEQADAGRVTPATDVWALGLLAYHLLTGSLFWNAARGPSALTGLLVEILVEPLPASSARAREHGLETLLPPGFDAWFSRCVAREPAARFEGAGPAIAGLLALLRDGSPAGAPDTLPQALERTWFAPSTPQLGGITEDTSGVTAPPPPRVEAPGPAAGPRDRRLLAAAALAALAVLGTGVGLAVHGLDGRATRPAPAPASPPASPPVARLPEARPDAGNIADDTGAASASAAVPLEPAREGARARARPAAPTAAPRGRPPAADPVAPALRAWLDRCVRDNLASEPAARWTFTLRLGPSGAENVAIVGPHAGEPSGPYVTFRRCVVETIRGFDPGADPGPITLSLP